MESLQSLKARAKRILRAEVAKSHRGRALVAEGRRKHRKSHSRKHTGRRSNQSPASGRALVAEGRYRSHSTHRRATSGMALRKHTRKHHSQHRRGSALVRHSRHSRHSHRMGSAMLAGRRKHANKHLKRKPRGNHSALMEINKITKELKRQHPHLEHKEAISKASAQYRGEGRYSKRHSRRSRKHY